MSDQHCPGFEANKTLNEVKLKCPECGVTIEIFSDEIDKTIKCPECGVKITPKDAVSM
ncbi:MULTISPECIES: hypothetical protein [Desulfosediminicola]|uniref:hypothetical protein n=1 Tax=Desulfosediminicola TaxID=2886823 RepID=UPI00142E9A55|nr:hypothetical protein [Desulfosediminicola ganghwensis]